MALNFNIVKSYTSSQIIVKQILNSLEKGELQEGQKLPSEQELCRIFGVSRSPVRDAVKTLVGMGRLEVIQGKGIYICQGDKAERN